LFVILISTKDVTSFHNYCDNDTKRRPMMPSTATKEHRLATTAKNTDMATGIKQFVHFAMLQKKFSCPLFSFALDSIPGNIFNNQTHSFGLSFPLSLHCHSGKRITV
jgi:hypothetical protein